MNGYLVLSRHKEESCIITCPDGTRIEVLCVEIRGDKVRLGFKAPREYSVHRSEVQKLVDAEAKETTL